MKTDVLTVVTTGYDDTTGFYVNGKLVGDVHCNDTHEIPGLLYALMKEYNFLSVEKRCLTDEARDRVFEDDGECPRLLSAYSAEDFET